MFDIGHLSFLLGFLLEALQVTEDIDVLLHGGHLLLEHHQLLFELFLKLLHLAQVLLQLLSLCTQTTTVSSYSTHKQQLLVHTPHTNNNC